MVMLTNGSFTHEVNAFFATRGVRVMDALQYPAMRRWAETPSSAYHDGRPSSFERVCMYRVAPTWFTQYDTVLVTDLDLWKQQIPVERFLSKLTQRYALNSVLAATSKEGFQVAEQTQAQDGSIELVVTRWDA